MHALTMEFVARHDDDEVSVHHLHRTARGSPLSDRKDAHRLSDERRPVMSSVKYLEVDVVGPVGCGERVKASIVTPPPIARSHRRATAPSCPYGLYASLPGRNF